MGSVSTNSATSTRYAKSIEAHGRRSRVIAGGVNSNVRLASRPVPLTFARAAGAHLWDVDGNEYIDYAGGMGPMLLGHNHPRVLDCRPQRARGRPVLRRPERVRSGVRRAARRRRAVDREHPHRTCRDPRWTCSPCGSREPPRVAHEVLRFVGHYHGWLDPLLVGLGPDPRTLRTSPGRSRAVARRFRRRRSSASGTTSRVVEQVLSTEQVACVIMEPVMCNTGLIPPDPGYLEGSATSAAATARSSSSTR